MFILVEKWLIDWIERKDMGQYADLDIFRNPRGIKSTSYSVSPLLHCLMMLKLRYYSQLSYSNAQI